MDILPDVRELLASFKAGKVFFDPLWGNHGDKLITMGSLAMFRKCGISLSRSPGKADIIILNGGAGMTPYWDWGGLRVVCNYAKKFPEKPILVLPSSWQVTSEIKLPERGAPLYLYAREPYSFELLQKIVSQGNICVGLDHDMAFHLQNTPFLEKLNRESGDFHSLIVERGDVESATGFRGKDSSVTHFVARMVPKKLRAQLPIRTQAKVKQIFLHPVDRILRQFTVQEVNETAFYKEALSLIKQRHPEVASLPVIAEDISLPNVCSFKQFTILVAKAAVVVTTRLHVAILAALLGKPTYLKEGFWHKIRGVYEYSLQHNRGVELI